MSASSDVLAVRFFRDTGYLVVPSCLADPLLARARREAAELFQASPPPVRMNSEGDVVRISRVFERGGVMAELFRYPPLLDHLERLLGPNIEFVLNRHNHLTRRDKMGKARRLHRDVLQWSRPIVTVLFYLCDARQPGLPTLLIPGSHLLPFVGTPNNGGTWMDEHAVFESLRNQAVPVPASAGDILLLDGLAFHAMGHAASGGDRLLLTGAYRSVDELISGACETEHVLVRGTRLYRGDS